MSAPRHVDNGTFVSFIALACASAYLDVIAYIGLGKVFVANMTGNTVLFALALGSGAWPQVFRHIAALVGFGVGVVVMARANTRHDVATDPRSQRRLLLGVTVWLAMAAVAWWLTTGRHDRLSVQLPLIAAFGAAMGAQATIAYLVTRPRIPVNFDTGLIITLLGSFAGADRDEHRRLHIGVIAALATGALGGAFALRLSTAPVAGIVPLLVGLAALAYRRVDRR